MFDLALRDTILAFRAQNILGRIEAVADALGHTRWYPGGGNGFRFDGDDVESARVELFWEDVDGSREETSFPIECLWNDAAIETFKVERARAALRSTLADKIKQAEGAIEYAARLVPQAEERAHQIRERAEQDIAAARAALETLDKPSAASPPNPAIPA